MSDLTTPLCVALILLVLFMVIGGGMLSEEPNREGPARAQVEACAEPQALH